jgi:hypothetical protein
MLLIDGSASNTGLHSNSASNTSAIGWRSFTFGYYMSNTSDWTNLIYFSVTSLPTQFSMAFYWFCDSQRNNTPTENYVSTRSGRAHINGYAFDDWGTNNYSTTGNGINNGGEVWGNGFNSVFIRDYAWAGTPCYVTYHLDVICNNWDKINVNFS